MSSEKIILQAAYIGRNSSEIKRKQLIDICNHLEISAYDVVLDNEVFNFDFTFVFPNNLEQSKALEAHSNFESILYIANNV